MNWTTEQEAIFKWFQFGTGTNLIASAVAGSGKSSSLVEGVSRSPEAKGAGRVVVMAFGQKVAKHLEGKFDSPYVDVRTSHAMGMSIMKPYLKRDARLDEDRGKRLARLALLAEMQGEGEQTVAVDSVSIRSTAKLADLAKQVLVDPKDATPIARLIYEYEIPVGLVGEEVMCDAAFAAMQLALEDDGSFDFTDMIYIPVRKGWVTGRYDLVCIDEIQDFNALQIRLMVAMKRKGGRIGVFGDPRQALYGFRGAETGSMARLQRELWAVELGLTYSFRCPRVVVERAKRLVPEITCPDNAMEGAIIHGGRETILSDARPGDFILSRTNAPLIGLCLRLIKSKRPARVEGRDFCQGLETIIDRVFKDHPLKAGMTRLAEWEKRETEKATKADSVARLVQIQDQVEAIRFLAHGHEYAASLKAELRSLMVETHSPQIVLSTIHRAKGLEAGRVFLLQDTLYPFYGAEKVAEERNIEYVGITRAMHTLYVIEGVGMQLWKVRMELGHTPACQPQNPADPWKGAWKCVGACAQSGHGVTPHHHQDEGEEIRGEES